ncbi:hypothetical protein [Rossellomorea sp. NS-SX7]|uniref:hypothetical protein n=1 Tax=Rossellomorea sp. NS-SX7 TaxID=3463856 RepID=UPI004059F027
MILAILAASSCSTAIAKEEYKKVAESPSENINVYAKEMNGLYYDFKIDFKGTMYSRPHWTSAANNPAYAPQIISNDINQDKKKELVIILNKGYGTGVLLEDVYVFHPRFREVLVDNPIAVVLKKVKTTLSAAKAMIKIDDKTSTVNLKPLGIDPGNLFDDIRFGSIIDFEVRDNTLTAKIAGQISPAGFIGEIVIVYEYRDNMYQAKSIEFQPTRTVENGG